MNLQAFIVLDVRLLLLTIVTSSGYGAVLDRTRCDDSYFECTESDAAVDLLGSVAHPDNDQLSIKLYQSNTTLNWCQSYHMCQKLSSELAVIADEDKQMAFEKFNVSLTSGQAWVAGTRKAHGNAWTWVTSDLSDCEENSVAPLNCVDVVKGKEFGYVQKNHHDAKEVFADMSNISTRFGICTNNRIDTQGKWTVQQNTCVSTERSRLATFTEINNTELSENTPYFFGLMYRPWLWIKEDEGRCMLQPVLYSNWLSAIQPYEGKDMCISVNIDDDFFGQWMEDSCATTLQYFFCEDLPPEPTTAPPIDPVTSTPPNGTGDTTTTEGSGDVKGANIGAIVGGLVGGLAFIVILVVIGYFVHKKKKQDELDPTRQGHVNIGASNEYNGGSPGKGTQQVNPYGVVELSSLDGPQSEAAAYRPGSAQYAEVGPGGVTLQSDLKKAPPNAVTPSQYALARPISEEAKGGPATYGEVKKRDDDDEVIIVDNQNYGAYNPAVDRKVPSGRGQQLPPIAQDIAQNKPAPATKPPKPKLDKPTPQAKNV